MRKDFYLFRHGETAYNHEGRWQGRSVDLPLDATGLAQAEILAKNLAEKELEVIYSSPLARARQTAQAVAAAAGVEVRILPELTEGALGVCEGMFKTDIAAQYPELWHKWYDETTATNTRWPVGESKLEMQQRMFRGFEKMLSAPENIIGAASHSGSCSLRRKILSARPRTAAQCGIFCWRSVTGRIKFPIPPCFIWYMTVPGTCPKYSATQTKGDKT